METERKTILLKNVNEDESINRYFNREVIMNNLQKINISVVMTSSNRSLQTYFTLKTINENSLNKYVQVILVDDSTSDPISISKLYEYTNIRIDFIKITNKDWINPVVNYNIGFKFILGEKIIIQNAEVCHIGDVIGFVSILDVQNMENKYYVFDVQNTGSLENNQKIYQATNISHNILINEKSVSWYQHSEKHNYMLHFLTCLNSSTFSKIKGFNYDYAYSIEYEDNDFLLGIVSKNIQPVTVSSEKYKIGGIHLYHGKSNFNSNLINRNMYLSKLFLYNGSQVKENYTYDDEVRETKKFYSTLKVEKYSSDNVPIIKPQVSNNPIKLTILIPTVPSRLNYFYPRIMNELIKQTEKYTDIELLALFDNKKRSIGAKRQEMLNLAKGEYVTFIDDDDRISDDYIKEILDTLYKNPGTDCLVYNVICCIDGKNSKLCKYGIEYEYVDNGSEWKGKPAHTMVWKSCIAKKHPYSDMARCEDVDWVKRACLDIKSQIRIDKVLYYYDANYSTTSETVGLNDATIKRNVENLIKM